MKTLLYDVYATKSYNEKATKKSIRINKAPLTEGKAEALKKRTRQTGLYAHIRIIPTD